MRTVTRYVANDGSEWPTAKEADWRDAEARVADEALEILGPRPDLLGFTNGNGYMQHDPSDVLKVRSYLVEAAKLFVPGFSDIFARPIEDLHPHGIVGRILSDRGGPLDRAWSRLMCIDGEGREWGQPYFALNPGQGELVEIPRVPP
jgi:hypothetical protein